MPMPVRYTNVSHILPIPYDCGFSIDKMTIDQIRELKAEPDGLEKESPFVDWYYKPRPELQSQMKDALNRGQLSSDKCYMPSELMELIYAGEIPECGYGVCQNGVGYSCVHAYADGITDEMVDYYNKNFAKDENCRTLYYKIWCPKSHMIHFTDAIVEDFGFGYQIQVMDWFCFRFEHMGLDPERLKKENPDVYSVFGCGGTCTDMVDTDKQVKTTMIQVRKMGPKGPERYVFYWRGLEFVNDGSTIVCPVEEKEVVAEYMGHMMHHAMDEMTNLLDLINKFWEQR